MRYLTYQDSKTVGLNGLNIGLGWSMFSDMKIVADKAGILDKTP